MKKLTAIAFCGLLLFNWFGYQLLCQWLQQKADHRLQTHIEQGSYNPAQLIELSVAVNLPYTTNWNEWENTEGNIEIDGILYRYVQRKLQDGRLYVRCLPQAEKQMVLSARDQFVKLSLTMQNGHSENKGQQSKITISNYIGDYDDNLMQAQLATPTNALPSFTPLSAARLPERPTGLLSPPPEHC